VSDLPNAVEAERALLGCLLLDPGIATKVAGQVSMAAWYRDAHRVVCQAIFDLGSGADLLTVTDRMRQMGKLESVGGVNYVSSLPNLVPTADHWPQYAGLIVTAYLQRQLAVVGRKIAALATEDPATAVDKAAGMIREIRRSRPAGAGVVAVEDVLPQVLSEMQVAMKTPAGDVPGVPYGFRVLDDATAGQFPGEIITISGMTSRGKSVLAGQLWEVAAQRRGPALICSNEMGPSDYVRRLLSKRSRVNSTHIRRGRLSDDEMLAVTKAMGVLSDRSSRMYVQPICFSVERVREGIESVIETCGSISWVALDWLQNLRSTGESRVQELDRYMTELKEAALEYQIPIVVVSQVDKRSTIAKAGGLGSARGSIMIEQIANTALEIDEVDPPDDESAPSTNERRYCRIVVKKARDGSLVSEDVMFLAPIVQFVPLETRRQVPQAREASWIAQ